MCLPCKGMFTIIQERFSTTMLFVLQFHIKHSKIKCSDAEETRFTLPNKRSKYFLFQPCMYYDDGLCGAAYSCAGRVGGGSGHGSAASVVACGASSPSAASGKTTGSGSLLGTLLSTPGTARVRCCWS
ncbi:hypothetical protein VPH35_013596 [Triticum aestivum]